MPKKKLKTIAMKNLKITSQSPILNLEKDEISIVVIVGKSMTLFNKRNQAFFFYTYGNEECPSKIYLRHVVDGKSNVFGTGGFNFSFCGKSYELENPGDSVNIEDGSIAVCLKYSYMLELLESSFYVYGQTKVYDFMKEEFLIPLS